MSSSACVASTICCRPARTRSGPPTTMSAMRSATASARAAFQMRVHVLDRRQQRRALAAHDSERALVHAGGEEFGALVGLRGERGHAHHHVRAGRARRGPELAPVDLERFHQVAGREVRGERVRPPDRRGEVRAVRARSQDPDRHVEARAGNRLHLLVLGCAGAKYDTSSATSLVEVGAGRVAPQRPHGERIGARARGPGPGRCARDRSIRACRPARPR